MIPNQERLTALMYVKELEQLERDAERDRLALGRLRMLTAGRHLRAWQVGRAQDDFETYASNLAGLREFITGKNPQEGEEAVKPENSYDKTPTLALVMLAVLGGIVLLGHMRRQVQVLQALARRLS